MHPAERLDPVLANVGYITAQLREWYGVSVTPGGVVTGEGHVWLVQPRDRRHFNLWFTPDALKAGRSQLDSWLQQVIDDARTSAPALPGYYEVDPDDGVRVLSMRELWFTHAQKLVYCCVVPGSPEMWHASVLATEYGAFLPAARGDVRDDVKRAAVDFLMSRGAFG